MIAWVWPADTVRSTPRRISRASPAPSITLTCRSWISRVAMNIFSCISSAGRLDLVAGPERDEDVVALDLHPVGGHRLGGRRPGGLAGPQVEAGPVQVTLHRVVVDIAFGQRYFLVRAHVVQGEHLAAGADHRHRHVADVHPDRPLSGQ